MVCRRSDPGAWLSVLFVMLALVLFAVGGLVLPTFRGIPVDPATLGPEAYSASCQFVTQGLKCPTTAIYPDKPTATSYDKGIWTVVGYVDAQNSFGAMIRSKWGVVLHTEDEGKTWVLDSLVID